MKQLKLTEKEQEFLKKLSEVKRKENLLKLEDKKLMAEFWFLLNSRTGGGQYQCEFPKGIVYELTEEEIIKAQNSGTPIKTANEERSQ